MLKDAYPYYLANEAVFANQDLDVTDKYSGEPSTPPTRPPPPWQNWPPTSARRFSTTA